MHCVVTAGPTYEELDAVRRLTNFSTGRLGSELATCLTGEGHRVTLLIGQQSSFRGERLAAKVETFSTTADLGRRLARLGAASDVDAVFHAAAVSDFKFGAIWKRSEGGELTEVRSGKISTREGTLLAELVPTVKLIGRLREWFPAALLVGWKYEVDRDRASALALAARQISECRTDACVANGPAYGPGFGLVRAGTEPRHLEDGNTLYQALAQLLK